LSFGVPKDIGRFFADLIIGYRRDYREYSTQAHRAAGQLIEVRRQALEAHTRSIMQSMSLNLNAAENSYYRLQRGVPALTKSLLRNRSIQLGNLSKPAAVLGHRVLEGQANAFSYLCRRIDQYTARALSQISEKLRLYGARTCAQLGSRWEKATSSLLAFDHCHSKAKFIVEMAQSRLVGLETLIQDARPEVQLKRGFVMVRKFGADGFITRASELKTNDQVVLSFVDAERKARIDS
jgi:exonuclease VII large subunit